VNSAVGARSRIVTECEIVSGEPSSSFTVRVTVYIPSSLNVNSGFGSEEVPSPAKSQDHETIVSGEEVESSLNCTAEPSCWKAGDHVNSALGPRSQIVTSCEIISIEPSSSSTMRVTVYAPSSINVNDGFGSEDVPSPAKFQDHETIVSGNEVEPSLN